LQRKSIERKLSGNTNSGKKHHGKNSSLCRIRNWKNTILENRKPRNMNSGKNIQEKMAIPEMQ